MDNQHEIFQEVTLPKEQDCELHNGNGNMANQQELDPVDTCLKRPPITLQMDGNGDDDQEDNRGCQVQRKLQELQLQHDGESNDNIRDGNGNMPNQQQLDPVEICLERPPIVLQKDGNINDDNKDGNPNGQPQKQFQEQFRGQGDDNGQIVTNQTHQQDEYVTPVRYFDIWVYHLHLPQAIQYGHHVPHPGPPVANVTRIPQWPPSFVVAMRNGPGPYAAIVVSMIPNLHLCYSFGNFILRLQECFHAVVGKEVQNPTDEGLIPRYRMNYFLLDPREKLLGFRGIPWEEFKFRLALVAAWEI